MQAWILFFAHRKVGLQPGPLEGEYACRCGFCSLHIESWSSAWASRKGIYMQVWVLFFAHRKVGLQPGLPDQEYTSRCAFLLFALGK